MKTYTIESFTTGQRRDVTAADWPAALDGIAGDHFTVVKLANGQFMAGCNENSVFKVAGSHLADTPTAAADSIRSHYRAVQAVSA